MSLHGESNPVQAGFMSRARFIVAQQPAYNIPPVAASNLDVAMAIDAHDRVVSDSCCMQV